MAHSSIKTLYNGEDVNDYEEDDTNSDYIPIFEDNDMFESDYMYDNVVNDNDQYATSNSFSTVDGMSRSQRRANSSVGASSIYSSQTMRKQLKQRAQGMVNRGAGNAPTKSTLPNLRSPREVRPVRKRRSPTTAQLALHHDYTGTEPAPATIGASSMNGSPRSPPRGMRYPNTRTSPKRNTNNRAQLISVSQSQYRKPQLPIEALGGAKPHNRASDVRGKFNSIHKAEVALEEQMNELQQKLSKARDKKMNEFERIKSRYAGMLKVQKDRIALLDEDNRELVAKYSALELEYQQLQEQNQGVDKNLKREIQFQKRLINELKGEKDSMNRQKEGLILQNQRLKQQITTLLEERQAQDIKYSLGDKHNATVEALKKKIVHITKNYGKKWSKRGEFKAKCIIFNQWVKMYHKNRALRIRQRERMKTFLQKWNNRMLYRGFWTMKKERENYLRQQQLLRKSITFIRNRTTAKAMLRWKLYRQRRIAAKHLLNIWSDQDSRLLYEGMRSWKVFLEKERQEEEKEQELLEWFMQNDKKVKQKVKKKSCLRRLFCCCSSKVADESKVSRDHKKDGAKNPKKNGKKDTKTMKNNNSPKTKQKPVKDDKKQKGRKRSFFCRILCCMKKQNKTKQDDSVSSDSIDEVAQNSPIQYSYDKRPRLSEKQLTGWSEKDKPRPNKTHTNEPRGSFSEKRRSSIDIYDSKRRRSKVVINPNDYQLGQAAKRFRRMIKRDAAKNEGDIWPFFNDISGDNDSFSILDFQLALDERQVHLSDERIEAFFGLIDKDGHGRVTFEDFTAFYNDSDSKVASSIRGSRELRSMPAPRATNRRVRGTAQRRRRGTMML